VLDDLAVEHGIVLELRLRSQEQSARSQRSADGEQARHVDESIGELAHGDAISETAGEPVVADDAKIARYLDQPDVAPGLNGGEHLTPPGRFMIRERRQLEVVVTKSGFSVSSERSAAWSKLSLPLLKAVPQPEPSIAVRGMSRSPSAISIPRALQRAVPAHKLPACLRHFCRSRNQNCRSGAFSLIGRLIWQGRSSSQCGWRQIRRISHQSRSGTFNKSTE